MLQEEKSDQAAAIYSKCTAPSQTYWVLLVYLLSGCWKQEEKEEERFFGGGC